MDKLVILSDRGNPITNSLLIAEKFNKEHKDVLFAIRNLVAENSAAKYFWEVTYENRGKNYPMFIMTRDGFSLLVMGFTGSQALKRNMTTTEFMVFINQVRDWASEFLGAYIPDPEEQIKMDL